MNPPNNKKQISLCMIVRNEEMHLERCLKSAAKLADEIILVDTGSTDRTKEIGRRYGARIFDFEWNNDFSAARNHSLKKAEGEWILVLDADEYLAEEKADEIIELTERPKAPDFYLLPVRNIMSTQPVEYQSSLVLRLFKNSPDLFYSGKIHEQILVSNGKTVEIVETGPYIIHLGYLDKSRFKKNFRNMQMLKTALCEQPENPCLHFYISTEHILQKDYDNALFHIRKALAGIPQDVLLFRTASVRNAIVCFTELGLLNEAEKLLKQELELHQDFSDYYYYLGSVYRHKGCFAKAIEQYRRALAVKNPSLPGCSISGTNGYKSLYYIGLCQQKMRRYFDAIDSYKSALDNNPSFTTPLADLVRCLLIIGTPESCLQYLTENFDIVSPHLKLQVAQVLYTEGYPTAAGEYISSLENPGSSPKTMFFLGELALANGNPVQAENYFKKVPENDPLYISSLVYRCICRWKQNKKAPNKLISVLKKLKAGKMVSGLLHYINGTLQEKITGVGRRNCSDTAACLKFALDMFNKLLELDMAQQAGILYHYLIKVDPGVRPELIFQYKKAGINPGLICDISYEPVLYAELAHIYERLSLDFLTKVPILPEIPLPRTSTSGDCNE